MTTADKIRGLIGGKRPLVRRAGDDPGAVLFTSGSEGTPKGVVLSNRNMLANVAQVAARIDFGPTDKVFNVLPVFHAFGLTGALVLPLVSGVPVYLYPSPLHYRIVPELIYGSNATVLFGTDTFLAGYARSAHAYDLRSLRYVVAGAEAVKDATRKTWVEKFGLRILEGYGVTECGPIVAVNTPMFNRFGTVGRILPGIEWRLAPVQGIEEGGRLSVRGPNVMLGYLRAEKPGVLEPPPEGWHDTGDIVDVDAGGFVTIKGRAKRFAQDRRRDGLPSRASNRWRPSSGRTGRARSRRSPTRARASGSSCSRRRGTPRAPPTRASPRAAAPPTWRSRPRSW